MSEIEDLKKRAAKLYREMNAHLETADCGIKLLSFIRPSFGLVVDEFDKTMARLKEIDPNFPKEGL